MITGDGVEVGVYAVHFGSGREIAVNADRRFPTASTVKVPILFALYRKAEAGEIDLQQRVTIEEQHRTAGSGVLQDLDLGLATDAARPRDPDDYRLRQSGNRYALSTCSAAHISSRSQPRSV